MHATLHTNQFSALSVCTRVKKIVLPGKCVFARFHCLFICPRAFNYVQIKQYLRSFTLLHAYLLSVLRPQRHRIFMLYHLAWQKGKYSSASWSNTWPILYVLPAQSPPPPPSVQARLSAFQLSPSLIVTRFVTARYYEEKKNKKKKTLVSDVCCFVFPQHESVWAFLGGNCKATWCKSMRHSLQLCT